jgi:hypothetical protein
VEKLDKENSPGGRNRSWNPLTLLREARRAVPAVRFALGVLGVLAAGAIAASWFVNLRTGFITFIGLLLCMYLLLFFAVATNIQKLLKIPVLLSACVIMFIFTVSLGLAACFVFTGWPEHFGRFFNTPKGPEPAPQQSPTPLSDRFPLLPAKPSPTRNPSSSPSSSVPPPSPTITPGPTVTPVFITMQVIDKNTGAGIPGANVECGDKSDPENVITEPSGKFSCHFLSFQKTLAIYIEVPGYNIFENQVNLNEIKAGKDTIKLEPK